MMMIKSIASSKTRRLIASASRSNVERTLQQQQRRLFAQGRVVATGTTNNPSNNSVVENDDWKNDRERFFNTIGEVSKLRVDACVCVCVTKTYVFFLVNRTNPSESIKSTVLTN